ncbi:hypothetical protein STENM327S_05786 [Streptomyces tendae]
MATATSADSPGSSAGTAALPAARPSTVTSVVVAAEAAVPALRTVAFTVTSSRSFGAAGDQSRPVTVRSGAGAALPSTWNSATWPPGAPVLEKNRSRTSETRPLTGMVTALSWPGLKA